MVKNKIEYIYGSTIRYAFKAVNPIKKKIMKTPCIVHKFINRKALDILRNEKENDAYRFFHNYINEINKGVVWADQDFKSINHFFHHKDEKGLYGFSNAFKLCNEYYDKAIQFCKCGDMKVGMFYLGAACHLIQDSTVPQHVHNKLLKQHRSFELWIKYQLVEGNYFKDIGTITRYEDIYEYIKSNAENSCKIYYKCEGIHDIRERYRRISTNIIIKAQSSTAGVLMDFYHEYKKTKK